MGFGNLFEFMLDTVSGGRAMFGTDRGLSRSEYAPFRIPMEESRGRFDESARMILDALETGWIEGSGPYYPQPRTRLRPDPIGSFKDRLYCVAGSAPSVEIAVELGARRSEHAQNAVHGIDRSLQVLA